MIISMICKVLLGEERGKTVGAMDELNDGFEEFRMVQEGANVDGSEDTRAVRGKLQRRAEVVPCGTVEEIVGPSF
jgi:hypothetical protein